jgi:hypothetical protein
MADTVTFQATPATPPAGFIAATDDCGAAGHVQVLKLAISTDGSATFIPADTTSGLWVNVKALPALPAGTNSIGTVVSKPGGTTAAQTSVTSTTTQNTQLLAADANRIAVTIYNESTSILYVLWASGAESTTVYSTQVAANGFVEVPPGFAGQRISGHWATANGFARITALT